MALSAAGLLAIAGYEGFSNVAYQPLPGDKWTIGFGHTEDVQPENTISLQGAIYLLQKDVRRFEDAVNSSVKVPLKQHEFDALVSLTYNIGVGNFKSSTLLKCLNAGDRYCVADQWLRWKYFKGVPQRGLANRRARELAIFNGEQVTTAPDSRICFGSAGCIGYSDLLQERMRAPDNASQG